MQTRIRITPAINTDKIAAQLEAVRATFAGLFPGWDVAADDSNVEGQTCVLVDGTAVAMHVGQLVGDLFTANVAICRPADDGSLEMIDAYELEGSWQQARLAEQAAEWYAAAWIARYYATVL